MNLLLGLVGRVTGNPMLLVWIALVAFVAGVTVGGGAAWKVQGWRLNAVKAEFKGFVDTTRVMGEAALKDKARNEAEDKRNKEMTDAKHKRTTVALRADIKRLRDARAGGGGLSAPAPAAGSPDRTCFDPAKLDSALRELDKGFLGIVEIGSQAVIDLDSAKEWAKNGVRE